MVFELTSDEMNGLTDDQKDAIIDVMVAGVLATGDPGDDEFARFDTEIRKVPWGRTEPEMNPIVEASFRKILAVQKYEDALEIVNAAAARLPDPNIREKTFALLARTVYAGQALPEQKTAVLTAFCEAFGITLPRLSEIADAVKKDA